MSNITKKQAFEKLEELAMAGELNVHDISGLIVVALTQKDSDIQKVREQLQDTEVALIASQSKPSARFGDLSKEEFIAKTMKKWKGKTYFNHE